MLPGSATAVLNRNNNLCTSCKRRRSDFIPTLSSFVTMVYCLIVAWEKSFFYYCKFLYVLYCLNKISVFRCCWWVVFFVFVFSPPTCCVTSFDHRTVTTWHCSPPPPPPSHLRPKTLHVVCSHSSAKTMFTQSWVRQWRMQPFPQTSTYCHAYNISCYPPLRRLHSHFGDFNNGDYYSWT